MSARARFLLTLLGTIFALSVALGYMGGRAVSWHERGWLGVFFFNGAETDVQRRLMGFNDGEVMMTVAGSPADGRLRYRDEVLSINGIPRQDTARLRALDASAVKGTRVVFRVRRGKQVLDIPMTFDTPLRARMVILWHIMALVVGLTFAGIGLLITTRAPGDTRATVFFALSLISAMAIMGAAATIYEQANGRGLLGPSTPALTRVLALTIFTLMYPPLILHLALIFPRRRPSVERRPVLIRWIYAVALVSIVMMLLSIVLSLVAGEDPTVAEARMERFMDPLAYVYVGLSVLVTLYILFVARKEGIRTAIFQRPFLVSLASFGLLLALADAGADYLPKFAAKVLGVGSVLLPVAILISFPFLACVALYRSYRAANVEEKRQVAWPLFGLLITVIGKILGYVLVLGLMSYITFTRRDLIAWRGVFEGLNLIPTLLTLLIPISFAVAILKYRLMNIDVILRKTVVYAILSGAIVVVYLTLVGGLGSALVYMFGLENQSGMVIASTLVVALLFVPVRNRLQFLVDRNLFRHRYDYPEALKAIAAEGRSAHDVIDLLTSAAEKLQQALQNRALVIFAERQEEFLAVAKVGVADSLLGRLRVPGSFDTLLDRPFDPTRRTVPDDAAAALAKVEAVLVVPVGRRAFIAAAPKLSGGGYDVEDIDFLRSVAEQLDGAIERIRMQAEEADFAQASAIQQTLLPREMPKLPKLDVSGVWKPARTMGGDYYDLIVLSEQELAVCIGDVAGKGMPAALLMSGLQAAVRASASSSPRDLCERVRRVVVSSLSGGRFVTFFYATVDTAAMRLRWCNAGHNAPILARADGTLVRLEEGGPAFSRLFRGAFEEREIELRTGDRLVLFTDGVSEASDGTGELFGEARIEELVTGSRDLGAGELQRTLVDAATTFSQGELEDDLTLVVVRVTE